MMQEGTNNPSLSKYKGEEIIFSIHKTMVEAIKKACKLFIKSLSKNSC
jgi:hypothetical protein